jgi:PAS domain S-box-containing protein
VQLNGDIRMCQERAALARPAPAIAPENSEAFWLASIVESSHDAIVSKNLDGVIMSWNAGAERLFGYSAAEAIGQPITIVIPEDRRSEAPAILKRIRCGERVDQFETVRRRKSGELIDISLTVSPVRNAEGEIIGASKIARDITERRRTDERIAALALEAEHRAKNILATVQATVHLSRGATVEEFKQVVEARIRALANVHALFAAARWTGADLAIIARQELAPYLVGGDVRARVDGESILLSPPLAQAIAVTLHELATNAAKYGALSVAGGFVEVSWSRSPDGRIALCWSETGGPPAIAPKSGGFGTKVIERLLRGVGSEIRHNWRPEGLVCELSLRV